MYNDLGRFDVRHHVDSDEPDHDNLNWARVDLIIVMWIYATISDELLDVVMSPNTTAYDVWILLKQNFCDNKRGRAIHLESAFHSTVQGDLSITTYCRKLKSLTDVDQLVSDEMLTLQMIQGQP